jgi:branched-chain amino acid transport system substrate-binding protein
MKKSNMKRFGALVVGLSFVAVSCGSSDEAATEDATATEDCIKALTIGTILPVTGDLAFLGPPEVIGADLAVADINAAGGINGSEVTLLQGDSGDLTTDIANTEVDRLLAAGSSVIIGAAASGVTKTVIDKITTSGNVMFSPANTSAELTTYADNNLYFRTAPSDILQGKVIADLVVSEGHTNAAILYRQDSWGQGLFDSVSANFVAAGGTVVAAIAYAPDGTNTFDAEVDQVVAAAPDAIIILGFAESGPMIDTLHARGAGPTDIATYGSDGNISGLDGLVSDPAILQGMRGTEPSVDLATITSFTDRLKEAGVEKEFVYGAETYDAVIISALAAAVAGCSNGTLVGAAINDVTRGGEKCTTVADCLALIAAGTDIDYDGIGGPYEFTDAGEPASASYRIATFGPAGQDAEKNEYVFAS